MSDKSRFWLTAVLLLSLAVTLQTEPSNHLTLPGEFTHPGLAAMFVQTTAELRSVYGFNENWHNEFSRQLHGQLLPDCVLVFVSALLFGLLTGLRRVRFLIVAAALAGLLRNVSMWLATSNATFPPWLIYYPALVWYGWLGVAWIVIGHKFLQTSHARRKIAILGAALLIGSVVWAYSVKVLWPWGAFLLPVAFVAASLLTVILSTQVIGNATQALKAGAGIGYLSAGVIVVFSVLFANARIELAFAPVAVALLLQLAYFNVCWVQGAHHAASLQVEPS